MIAKPLTDWRGVEILVGSTVIYPTRHGSSQTMNEAVVERIEYDTQTVYNWDAKQNIPTLVPRLYVRKTREAPYMYTGVPKTVKLTRLDLLVVVAPTEPSEGESE